MWAGPHRARQVDAARRHLGLDAEWPLVFLEQMAVNPDRLAAGRRQGEHGARRVPVDDAACQRHPVRPLADGQRRVDGVLP